MKLKVIIKINRKSQLPVVYNLDRLPKALIYLLVSSPC